MILLPIHWYWFFLPWCQLWLIFRVPIIPLGACYAYVSLANLHPCIQKYYVGYNFALYSFPVVACPPYFCWCPPFDAKREFFSVWVLIWSIKKNSVSSRCLMVLVIWVSKSFSGVLSISKLSSASEIFSFVVMDVLVPWNPAWFSLMYFSSRISWYSSVNKFLNPAHVFPDEGFLRQIFMGSVHRPVSNNGLYVLFIIWASVYGLLPSSAY